MIKKYIKIACLIIALNSTMYSQGAYSIGINFPYISISGNQVKLNTALGGGVNFQYNMSEKLSITAIICAARHDMKNDALILTKSNSSEIFISSKWTLGWILGGLKYHFLDSSFIIPSIGGEIGFAFLSADFDNMLNGFAVGTVFNLGHYFNEHWLIRIGTNLRYTYLNTGTIGGESVKINNPINQTAITTDLAFSYVF